MWKRVDTPYKKDHHLKTMNIEKNYDNYKAQDRKKWNTHPVTVRFLEIKSKFIYYKVQNYYK